MSDESGRLPLARSAFYGSESACRPFVCCFTHLNTYRPCKMSSFGEPLCIGLHCHPLGRISSCSVIFGGSIATQPSFSAFEICRSSTHPGWYLTPCGY